MSTAFRSRLRPFLPLTVRPTATYSREFDSSSKSLTEQLLRESSNAFSLGPPSYLYDPGHRVRSRVGDWFSDPRNAEAHTSETSAVRVRNATGRHGQRALLREVLSRSHAVPSFRY